MNGIPSSEIVDAIYRLLPGFVTAWIFYGLTAHPKASSFERVIQALIFTLFVDAIVRVLGWSLVGTGNATGKTIGEWNADTSFIWKVVVAIGLGFLFAWFANTNRFHSWLPDSITRRTSFPSEWFSAFHRTKRFVYLQLNDGRRVFGWPEEWPDEPGKGHVILTKPEWILPDNTRAPLVATERLVVSATDVKFVEFEKDINAVYLQHEDIATASAAVIEFNASKDDDANNSAENEDAR